MNRHIIRYSWKWTRGCRCSAKERWSIRCHFYGPYHAYYGKYLILSPILCSTLVCSGPFVIFTICCDQENIVALYRSQLDASDIVSLLSSYLFNFVFMMFHFSFIPTATIVNVSCQVVCLSFSSHLIYFISTVLFQSLFYSWN